MRTFCGALLLSLMACASESTTPPTITVPPDDTDTQTVYSVPGGSSAVALVLGEGTSFQFTGPTAPGSATFTAAPYEDFEQEETPQFGGGSLNITLGGQLYSATNLHSLATTITDATDAYLALSGYAESAGPAGTIHIDAVLVLMPKSDYVPGATIVLDGQDRIALFAAGNPENETADVYGAAVTGTVQLGAGSATPGGTITATVDGEFGPIELLAPEPPVVDDLTPGTYALALDDTAPFDVFCDGSLAGQEAQFANLAAASLGFVDGSVDLTTGTSVTLSGAPIDAGFGAASLVLDTVDVGLYAAFTSQSGSGPAGTSLVEKFLILDATSSSATAIVGGLGALYEAADGSCQVGYSITLSAP
ncbi:MAG: hypothetical protein SFX73_00335 [Kofleriaceae bacterium]|nr:hypothetical protein [Kofleriaceae bacterium]